MYHQPYRETQRLKPGARGSRWKGFADQESMLYKVPVPIRPIVRAGGTYLGEDAHYYYYMHPQAGNELNGFFDNVGNMFARMVKFTPKSFTPGNIYKGVINTTLTAASGGLYQVLPSDIKKTVYEIGKVAVPVVAGGVLAYTAGPAIMATLMPKLTQAGSLLSKGAGSVMNMFGGGSAPGGQPGTEKPDYSLLPGATPGGPAFPDYGPPAPGFSDKLKQMAMDKAMTIGGEFLSRMMSLPPQAQAEVAQQITPEQLAYMEQYKQMPPEVQAMFQRAINSSLPMNPGASTGAADLYSQYGPPPPPNTANASMFGNLDMTTILLFAVPAVFFLFSNSKK